MLKIHTFGSVLFFYSKFTIRTDGNVLSLTALRRLTGGPLEIVFLVCFWVREKKQLNFSKKLITEWLDDEISDIEKMF